VGRHRVARPLLALVLACAWAAAGCGAGGGGSAGPPATTGAGARRFTNPVLPGNLADPFVLKVGDPWYAYATGDLVVNLQIARSTDLVRWQQLDDALPYYTLRDAASGHQCISVAVADRPEGPFRDTRSRPLVCQERLGGSLDPHRFVDRDGAAYLLWKNDGNCCGLPTELWGQRLDGDGLALEGRPRSLGVRNDAAGDLWLAYHAWDSSAVGDEAGGQWSMWLDRLRFENGRPRVEGPTDGPQEAP